MIFVKSGKFITRNLNDMRNCLPRRGDLCPLKHCMNSDLLTRGGEENEVRKNQQEASRGVDDLEQLEEYGTFLKERSIW